METETSLTQVRDRTWLASLIFSAIGLIDSAYLTWIKIADKTASCSGIGDCETVNTSRYSEFSGIPIALIGAGAYLVIVLLLLLELRYPQATANIRLGIFGLTLTGTLYSVYLTYLEIAVLKAICPFCALSAVVMLALFVGAILRLRSDLENP